jgi:hypothetical protein
MGINYDTGAWRGFAAGAMGKPFSSMIQPST